MLYRLLKYFLLFVAFFTVQIQADPNIPELSVATQSVTVTEDVSLNIDLGATFSVISVSLNYTFTTDPAHGELASTATEGVYTYSPTSNYSGADEFAFKAISDESVLLYDEGLSIDDSTVPEMAGHVAVDGDYAYVADYIDGVRIYDISDPSNPTRVATLNSTSKVGEVSIDGDYLYLAAARSGSKAFQSFDISDPTSPSGVGEQQRQNSRAVFISGSYAYLGSSKADESGGAFRIVDISTPSTLSDETYKDATARTYDIFVASNVAYLAESDKFTIINNLSSFITTNDGSNENLDHSQNSSYVLEVDALADLNSDTGSNSDSFYQTVYDVHVSGDYAYLSAGAEGFAILDISTPLSPEEVYFEDPGTVRSTYVDGDILYVVCHNKIKSYDITDPTNPTVRETYTGLGASAMKALTIHTDGVAYVADDEKGLLTYVPKRDSAIATVSITVTAVQDDPVFSSGTAFSVSENTTAVGTMTATDPDEDTVTFSITGGVDAALFSINESTGALVFDSAPDYNSPADSGENNVYDIIIGAHDPFTVVTQAITITVNQVAVVVVSGNGFEDLAVNEDAAVVTIVLDQIFDSSGYDVTYNLVSNTADSVVTTNIKTAEIATDNLILTFLSDQNGTATIEVQAKINVNNVESTVTDSFIVTVNAVIDDLTIDTALLDQIKNEDDSDLVIDISSVFTHDGGTFNYVLASNTNETLVTTSLDSNAETLTLDFLDNQNGTANITLSAIADGDSISDSFFVTVNAVNDVPTVGNMPSYTVSEDASDETVTLGDYFTEIDSEDTLIYTVSSNTNESLIDASIASGELTLDFLDNQNGTATIEIAAFDGTVTVSGEILVTVNEANDSPVVAAMPTFNVSEDASNETVTLSDYFSDVDTGDTLTYTVSRNTNEILLDATISSGELTLDFLDNKHGVATVEIAVTDGTVTVSGEILITVNAVNDSPVVATMPTFNVSEDATNSTVTLGNYFSDVDTGDTLTYTVSRNTNETLLDATISSGELTLDFLENKHGAATVEIAVTDGTVTVSGEILITVNAVNDSPVVATMPTFNVSEDASNEIVTLNNYFSDVDTGDTLTYTVLSNSNTNLINATISSGELTIDFLDNKTGSATLDIAVFDGTVTVNGEILITVNAVNDSPVVGTMPTFNVSEDASDETVTLNNYFSDEDSGDTLTYTVSSNSNQNLVDPSISNGVLTLDFLDNANGQSVVEIAVSDGTVTVSGEILVTVNSVNDSPVAGVMPTINVDEDANNSTVTLSDYFSDIEDGGSGLSYTVSSNSNESLLDASISSTTLTLDFVDNASGTAIIEVAATDGGVTISSEILVTVNAVNDSPVVATMPTFNVSEDASNETVTLSNYFSDVDTGDTLTYSVLSNSNTNLIGATISSGELTIDFLDNKTGSATLDIAAFDGTVTVNGEILITVNAVNDSPVAGTMPTFNVSEDASDETVTLNNYFSDADSGDTLTYTVSSNSNENLVDPSISNGVLTLDFLDNAHGAASIEIAVADGTVTISAEILVTVNAVNDNPTVATMPTYNVNEDASDETLTLSNYFSDVDTEDTLIYSVLSNSDETLLDASISSGVLTLDFLDNESGSATVTVGAFDGTVTVNGELYITVNAVNDLPVASTMPSVNVVEDANNATVTLSDYFSDVETASGSLEYGVSNNSNVNLVDPSISGSTLTIDFLDNANGSAQLEISAFDGTATSSALISINVSSVNDAPVALTMPTINVNEDANNETVTLSDYFTDVEDGGAGLTYTVSNNSNTTVLSASISGATLTLDFLENKNGHAVIEIAATDDSVTVSSEILVTVNAVNDSPVVATLPTVNVEEDANNETITLSDYFTDVETNELEYSVINNDNESLLSASISGAVLTLDFEENQNGTANIEIAATDGTVTVNGDILVTVNAFNDAPVAGEMPTYNVNEDASDISVTLSNYFSDSETATLSYTVNSNSNTDLLSTSISGVALTISLSENESGTANIVIRASDGGKTVDAGILVTVNAVNDSPVVGEMPSVNVLEDAANETVTLGNYFTDVDSGDTISYTVSGNSNESLLSTSIANGVLTLDFEENANGVATVEVAASDGTVTVSGEILVSVNAVNDSPVNGTMPTFSVLEDAANETVTLSDYFTDVDSGDTLSYTVSNNSNESLLTSTISNGVLTLDFAENKNGAATIEVAAFDGTVTVSAEILVTVSVVNDSPVVGDLPSVSVSEDANNESITLSDYFTDVDTGDTLSYTVSSNSNENLLSATISSAILTLDFLDNANGTAVIEVAATDGTVTVSGEILVSVNAVNDSPVVGDLPSVSVSEDADNESITLSNYFTDVDSGDTLSYSVSSNSNENLLSATISSAILTLDFLDNASGTAVIEVAATDGTVTVSGEILVSVNAANDSPVVGNLPGISVSEDDSNETVTLSDYFTDSDSGDMLSYTVSSNSNENLLSATISSDVLTVDFLDNANGTAVIEVAASDGTVTVSGEILVSVSAVNDSPVVGDLPSVSASEDASNETLTLSDYFTDIDTGDTLSYTVSHNNNEDLLSATISNAVITLDFLENANGTAVIEVAASDGTVTVSGEIVVSVSAVNDSPVVGDLPTIAANEDASNETITLSDYFTDVDSGDTLSYTVSSNSNEDLLSATIANGILTVDFLENASGTAVVEVAATDGTVTVSGEVLVSVSATNDSPVLSDLPTITVSEDASDETVTLSDYFTDSDTGDTLSYTVSSNSNENLLSATISSDVLTVDFLENANGTAVIEVAASDGTVTVSGEVLVSVSAVNDSPVVGDLPTIAANEDASNETITLSDYFTDVDSGDTLSYTVSSNSNEDLLSATIANGILTVDFLENASGTAVVEVAATDGTVTVSGEVLVSVSATNDSPVLGDLPTITVSEDASDETVTLSDYFTDSDTGDTLSYTVSSNSNENLLSATISSDVLTVDFLENANGTAVIEVAASDGTVTVSGEVLVSVSAVNDSPVVGDLPTIAASEDASNETITLSDYFTDVDSGDTLSYTVSSNSNEDLLSATISNDILTVDFLENASGTAVVEVAATDGTVTVSAEVLVSVSAVNDNPVAGSLPGIEVNEDANDETVTLSDYFTDVDSADTLTFTVSANSNEDLISTSLSNGVLTVGFFENANGSAVLEITASDGTATVSAEILVTVNASNDSPEMAPLPNFDVNEDASNETVTLSVYVTDSDLGDTISYTVSNNANEELLSATVLNGILTLDFVENAHGSAVIDLAASDGTVTVIGKILVTINAVNDSPVVGSLPAIVVNEDADTETVTLSDYVTDADSNDTLIFTVSANSNQELLTTSISGAELSVDFADDASGTAVIVVAATDGTVTVSGEILVSVNAVNESPVLLEDHVEIVVSENSENSVVDLTELFEDPDQDSLSYTATANTDGVVALSIENDELTIRYIEDATGETVIELTASDTEYTVTASIDVTVESTDEGPQVSGNGFEDLEVLEDADQSSIDLSSIFVDVDSSSISYQVLSNTDQTLLSTEIDGDTLIVSYLEDQNGVAVIEVEAEADNKTVSDSFIITVNAVDDAPQLIGSGLSDITVSEDAKIMTVNLDEIVEDIDSDLSFTVSGNSNTDLVSASVVSEELQIEIIENQSGVATLLIIAEGDSQILEMEFDLTVEAVNDVPSIVGSGLADVIVDEDSEVVTVNLEQSFEDGDGEALSFSVEENDNTALVTAEVSENVLRLEFEANAHGTANITIAVTAGGETATDSFSVIVESVNDLPVFLNGALSDQDVNEDSESLVINLGEFSSDADGDSFSYSIESDNSDLLSLSISGAVLTIDFTENANGTATLSLEATAGGHTITDTAIITVNAVNDAPIFVSTPNATIISNQTAVSGSVIVSDVEDSAIIFSLAGGSDDGLFEINSQTGALAAISSINYVVPTDSDGNGIYEVVLGASDGEKLSTETVKITVITDENITENITISTDSTVVEETEIVETTVVVTEETTVSFEDGISLTDSTITLVNSELDSTTITVESAELNLEEQSLISATNLILESELTVELDEESTFDIKTVQGEFELIINGGKAEIDTVEGDLVIRGEGSLESATESDDIEILGDLTMDKGTLYIDLTKTVTIGGVMNITDSDLIVLRSSLEVSVSTKTGGLLLHGKIGQDSIFGNSSSSDLEAGDSFQVLDVTTVEGEFNSITLPELDSDLIWDSSKLYKTGIVKVVYASAAPEIEGLALAYPNPMSLLSDESFDIGFEMSKDAQVKVYIYDMRGALRVTKLASVTSDEYNRVTITEADFLGGELSAGVYFYVIVTDGNIIGKGKVGVTP